MFSIMALVPCCRVQWLLVILAASLTNRLAQGNVIIVFALVTDYIAI